jgi:glycosyltransferase involved in cell wall biosynthesis
VQSELNVVIDAQISLSGSAGGVEQFIAGLVHALGKLDGTERYTVVGPCEQPDWLRPLLGPNQRIVSAPRPPERLRMIKRILGPLRLPLRAVMGRVRQAARARREVWTVPESSGFFESLGGEVVHFPHQSFVRSRLPTIYNPHDLQHRHLPGFFSRGEVARREKLYQAGCHHAQVVATASRWSAEDVERSYGVPRDRIVIVPSGASTELYEAATQPTLTEVMKRYRLPEVFALYPAQTWPHKNHLGLIRALAFLREAHGIALNVVCTGSKNRFFRTVVKETHERGVAKQLFFPGYIPGRDLRALYHLAQFLVFPSFFEGGGLPVVEALAEGLPVACSTATSLPEIVRDAALLFDPASPEAMAEVLWRMTTDVALLEVLRRRGYEQAARFSWERMGRTFRALYRRVAGRTLATEDRELLADSRLPPRVGPGPR